MFTEHTVMIVRTGTSQFFQLFGRQITVQIINRGSCRSQAGEFFRGMQGEGDVFHPVFQSHIFYQRNDFFDGFCFALGSGVCFKFKDQPGVEWLCCLQVFGKGRQALPVIQFNGCQCGRGGVFHSFPFECGIMVDH